MPTTTRTQMDWAANLATGHARCLYRYFKGEDYARLMDELDGIKHNPLLTREQAVLSARKLAELAQQMLDVLEGS